MKKSIFTLSLFFHFILVWGQTDTVPPVLVCSDQGTYHPVGGFLTIWPMDFVDSLYDNESADIEIGIRKSCTGVGFPEESPNVFYVAGSIGQVDVWARDEAGNTSMCSAQFTINTIFLEQSTILFTTPTVAHDTVAAQNIWQVAYHATAVNCFSDSLAFDLLDYSNEETWLTPWYIPTAGYAVRFFPAKNTHPLNGVTTHDLMLISRHILGLQPLDSPYKILAADANQDGKVTVVDIVTLRKLILGITDELPNGKSWRFIPEGYVFADPDNPFLWPVPEYVEIPATVEISLEVLSPALFKGIKIGDVDFSANPHQ